MKIDIEICKKCNELFALKHFLNGMTYTEYGCGSLGEMFCEEDFVNHEVPDDCELKAEYFVKECNEEKA